MLATAIQVILSRLLKRNLERPQNNSQNKTIK
jgi:hypothetical protein